jgi:hypothetical protein
LAGAPPNQGRSAHLPEARQPTDRPCDRPFDGFLRRFRWAETCAPLSFESNRRAAPHPRSACFPTSSHSFTVLPLVAQDKSQRPGLLGGRQAPFFGPPDFPQHSRIEGIPYTLFSSPHAYLFDAFCLRSRAWIRHAIAIAATAHQRALRRGHKLFFLRLQVIHPAGKSLGVSAVLVVGQPEGRPASYITGLLFCLKAGPPRKGHERHHEVNNAGYLHAVRPQLLK